MYNKLIAQHENIQTPTQRRHCLPAAAWQAGPKSPLGSGKLFRTLVLGASLIGAVPLIASGVDKDSRVVQQRGQVIVVQNDANSSIHGTIAPRQIIPAERLVKLKNGTYIVIPSEQELDVLFIAGKIPKGLESTIELFMSNDHFAQIFMDKTRSERYTEKLADWLKVSSNKEAKLDTAYIKFIEKYQKLFKIHEHKYNIFVGKLYIAIIVYSIFGAGCVAATQGGYLTFFFWPIRFLFELIKESIEKIRNNR